MGANNRKGFNWIRIASVTAAILLVISLVMIVLGASKTAAAVSFGGKKDCNSNSIINCGATTASELYSKYLTSEKAQHVYSAFGISAGDIRNLDSTAVAGYATKSGNVYLNNGQLVATDDFSAGFNPKGNHSTQHTFAGTTYYNTKSQFAFLSDSITGWVVMRNGKFQFMILASCGNPVVGKPVLPPPKPKPASLACINLKVDKKSDREFSFEIEASTQNATITNYTIDFGDGHTFSSTNNRTTHTYASTGTFLIRGSVTGTANGKTISDSGSCSAKITITPPHKKPPKIPPHVVTIVKKSPPPPPTHLVETGSGAVFAVAAGTVLTATIGSRIYFRRRYHL